MRARLQFDVDRRALEDKVASLTKQCNEYRAKLAETKKRSQVDTKEIKSLHGRIEKIEKNVNLHSLILIFTKQFMIHVRFYPLLFDCFRPQIKTKFSCV